MKRDLALLCAVAGATVVTLLMVTGLATRAEGPRSEPLPVVINEVAWGPQPPLLQVIINEVAWGPQPPSLQVIINEVAWGPQPPLLQVIINEVAWGGTAANPAHEWIELYNNTGSSVDLGGWTLASGDGSPSIALSGEIVARGYYLLERSSDCAVSDLPADQPPYTGVLGNGGERLELRDGSGVLIDTAGGSGSWPGGSGSPGYYSMERIDPGAPDGTGNWRSNDGVRRNGLDCDGYPLNGTPGALNSANGQPGADLIVEKDGPASVLPGGLVTYTLTVRNAGASLAQTVWLTDLLPAQTSLVRQTAAYPFEEPAPGTLRWNLGDVPTTTGAAPIIFNVVAQVDGSAAGELLNFAHVGGASPDSYPEDNRDTAVTVIGDEPGKPAVLIDAVHFDAYTTGELDEAIRLVNLSEQAIDLGDWSLTDQEETAVFPAGAVLSPGQSLWCTRDAAAFAWQFGFKPDYEINDTDPGVPALAGRWPRLANQQDQCLLYDSGGALVDALTYGGGAAGPGWSGPAVVPWTPTNTFAAEGQILYRKRDQRTGLPVPDTDTAADWAQDPGDQIDGRKVLYPGWDLDAFFFTQRVTETAVLTVAVAPDNLFHTVSSLAASAQESIEIASYSFRSKELAGILLERLDQGVSVSLFLEGAPAFGGVPDQEKWIVGQLYSAGAQVQFMLNDSASDAYDRYRNQHAKYLIVDGSLVMIGSENLSFTSMPADEKANGTAGRRGVYLITDAPGVVARARSIFDADADPANHHDIQDCSQVPHLCTPPAAFEPELTPDWVTYTLHFSTPQTLRGPFAFEVIQSPENSLRTADGLLGLLNRAAVGDTLLIQQLSERRHWGPADGTPETDPNPRLQAYLAAARRGTRVRILLDSYLDDDGANAATVSYLQSLAQSEGLDLQARQGNPAGLGLHNKMVLAHIGGRGYAHVGSINGSEVSAKINRELALQVQSDPAYGYLKELFDHDWRQAMPPVYLPLLLARYATPNPARHLLISEVYYASAPPREWIEIYNPTGQALDLSAFKLGDAVYPDDYEGMYHFPPGATAQPGAVLVVAATTTGFQEEFPALVPDWEILDTDPAVPDLVSYGAWGEGDWGLGNNGDEVLLLDGDDNPVDVIVFGDGDYPGIVAHPGVAYGHSLERSPAWLDTDDCRVDLRDWPYPSPGDLPR